MVSEKQKTSSVEIISFKNVDFRYPGSKEFILKNINLQIKKGERVGITGGNGCGKSTLSKLILGIFRPTNGSIYLMNQLVKWKTHFPNVGYIGDPGHNTQELGLPTNFTVTEIISTLSKLFKIEGVFVDPMNLMQRLGLLEVKERKVANLSTGERKRLMICLTFLHPPEFIILDEPFDGLDSEIIIYVKELLNSAIIKHNITLFFISHNQIEIDTYTNRVYQIHDKTLVSFPQYHFHGNVSVGNEIQKIVGKTGEIMGTLIEMLKSEKCRKGLIVDLKPTTNQ